MTPFLSISPEAFWVAPSFSVERARQALSESARLGEGLVLVMDWATCKLVFIEGSPEKLFGVPREELCQNPCAWERSLTAYDRATLVGLKEELMELRRGVRLVKALGGDGVLRTLRCAAHVMEIDDRMLLCGSVLAVEFGGEMSALSSIRDAVEHAREGLAVTDAAGILIYLNREHVEMFGYASATELVGKSWHIFYPPESIRYVESVVFPTLIERGLWRGELMAKKKDGSLFHEELSLTFLPGGGIVCNCRDVSEAKAVAMRLGENEELFKVFSKAMTTGMLIRSTNGLYEFVNAVAAGWFGLSAESPKGSRAGWNQPSPDMAFNLWAKEFRTVESTGETLVFDFPFSLGGRERVFEVQQTPLYLGTNKVSHVCTMVRDVTQQRLLEQQAEATARRSLEYSAMQREFISMVSHEFRTPLTSIQGVHYLLSKKAGQLPVRQVSDIERLLELQGEALSNLKELVDQVLLLNRLEHAATGEPLPLVCLTEFFSNLIEGLNISVANDRISLEMDLPVGFSAHIDAAKLRAACENLLSNGLKYSSEESKVRVKVILSPEGWCFSVTDCGRGIPETDQAKLFQPFHRASNVQGIPGTGLGLAIVRRVVDFHGGSVAFTTAVGAGSEFLLVFPSTLTPPSPAAVTGPSHAASATALPIAMSRLSSS